MASAPRVQAGSAISEWNPVISGLKKMYKEKVRPVEEMYKFGEFMSPVLNDADIEARPMVLLLGQYSTGKTSFIKYMLGRDFPGAHIGPEPTTDRFMAVMYGTEERTIPGNALSVQADRPFRGLSKFGTSFLCKFESSELPAPILESITFLDTPGVLAGEKQRIGRAYDFTSVIHWFAEKADLILLLFDANKLDISDEFKGAIETLKGHDDKIRVVLNKADSVSSQQLMRVYGALMWYLGKVVKTPEVVRVYIGSFWHQPLKNEELRGLFEVEQSELLRDLRNLPRNAAIRKLNDMVKRVRQVKLHAMLISTLRGEMPAFFGKSSKKSELIENLEEVFFKVHQATQIPVGDFPDVNVFRQQLSTYDLKKFPKLDKRMIEMLDEALSGDLARLMQFFPKAVDTGPKYLEPTIQSAMDQIHQALPPLMPRPGSAQESPRQQQQPNPYGQPQQGYPAQGAQPPYYPPQQQQQYSQYPQQAPPPQYQQPQQYYNPPQGQTSTPPPNQSPYQSQAPTQAPAYQSQAPTQAPAYTQAPTQAPAYQAYPSQAQPNPYGQPNPYQSQAGAHTSPYQSQASPYQSQAQYHDPAASMMAPVAPSGAAPPPIPPKRPLPQPQQQQ